MAVAVQPKLVNFSEMKKGMRARVASICPENPEIDRLIELGFIEGTEFAVVQVAPFGDPIEIEFRGCRLCLRKQETTCVDVEVLE